MNDEKEMLPKEILLCRLLKSCRDSFENLHGLDSILEEIQTWDRRWRSQAVQTVLTYYSYELWYLRKPVGTVTPEWKDWVYKFSSYCIGKLGFMAKDFINDDTIFYGRQLLKQIEDSEEMAEFRRVIITDAYKNYFKTWFMMWVEENYETMIGKAQFGFGKSRFAKRVRRSRKRSRKSFWRSR